jgi:hypothetical protein
MIKPNDMFLSLQQFDCARDICTFTWKDDNQDSVERLNEWGIMANNKENDAELALFYFTEAVDKGNIYAMINGFSVLWNAECYNRAICWLQTMNSKEVKNIKCLWNEAMLWFYGSRLENNPLKRNFNRAKELLDYIIIHHDTFKEQDKDNRKIVQRTYIFSLKHNLHKIGDDTLKPYEDWKIEWWQNRRNLAVTGNNLYYDLYNEYHHFPWDVGHCVGDEWLEHYVFRNLDELYLEEGWHLCITLGDIHGFYAYKDDKKKSLIQKLRGAIGKRAAWQSYLLYSAYRIMPLEDHDNYDACHPIFTTRDLDLNSFATFMPDNHYDKVIADVKALGLTDKDIYPRVHQISDHKYEVECIWWNDWKGLFMEKAIVEFDPKTFAPMMEVIGENIIYPYECPIDL